MEVCERFWKHAIEQNLVNNIILCETIEDIFYDCYLFEWSKTEEGDEYWCEISDKIISDYQKIYGTRYLSEEDERNNDFDFDYFDGY